METEKLNKQIDQMIILNNKTNLIITGTTKIISLKQDLVQLNTVLGNLQILGKNLELVKLDDSENKTEIIGEINSIKFIEQKSKEPFFRKIFK